MVELFLLSFWMRKWENSPKILFFCCKLSTVFLKPNFLLCFFGLLGLVPHFSKNYPWYLPRTWRSFLLLLPVNEAKIDPGEYGLESYFCTEIGSNEPSQLSDWLANSGVAPSQQWYFWRFRLGSPTKYIIKYNTSGGHWYLGHAWIGHS